MIDPNSLIQWPRAQYWDKPWNPIIGCQPISPACENCYAAAMCRRFNNSFTPHASSHENPPRSGVVFCGNMTDLFGEWRICGDMAGDIAACASRGFGAQYLWLTKRVRRMNAAMNYIGDRLIYPDRWFENHYFGFTAENQEWYDKRRMQCVDMPEWANSWMSLEPLLGSINYLLLKDPVVKARTKWLVVGCESGPNRRPCKIEWVESIVDQCLSANVPVFVKQLDLNGKCERDITKFPEHLRIRQVPWAKKEGV